MIIVLKNADFSASNIGQVQVTTELNPYTEAAIAASGNTSMTDEQKSALDNLFLTMGVDGSNNIMSKMRKVYLPILATSVDKGMINYATSDFTADFTPDPSIWTLRSHGLVATSSPTGNFTGTLSNPLVADNFSQFWLRTELMESGVNDSGYVAMVRGVSNTSSYCGAIESSANNNNYISWGSYGAVWGNCLKADASSVKAAALICRGANDCDANRYGTWTTRTGLSFEDLSNESSETLYMLGFATNNTKKPIGVVMLGEAVTLEQGKAISSCIDNLWNVFNV